MSHLGLQERMMQVNEWMGVVATRPLLEVDYEVAHTRPVSFKRAWDGGTYGATYMVRHSRRNFEKEKTARGVGQALTVPLAVLAMIVVPFSVCLMQRLVQKRVRSEDATRENTIAFELENAREVAKIVARRDQIQMLKNVHGMTRRDVVAWACTCLSLISKTLRDVDQGSDRIRNSGLIRHHATKALSALDRVRDQYSEGLRHDGEPKDLPSVASTQGFGLG